MPKFPGVAQIGSALEWGSRGRRFDSCHSDQINADDFCHRRLFILCGSRKLRCLEPERVSANSKVAVGKFAAENGADGHRKAVVKPSSAKQTAEAAGSTRSHSDQKRATVKRLLLFIFSSVGCYVSFSFWVRVSWMLRLTGEHLAPNTLYRCQSGRGARTV